MDGFPSTVDFHERGASNKQANLFGWSKSISTGLLSSECLVRSKCVKWCQICQKALHAVRKIVDIKQTFATNTQVLQIDVHSIHPSGEHGHDSLSRTHQHHSFKNTPISLRTPDPEVPDCCDLQLNGTPQQWKSWIMTVPMRGSYCWWLWLLLVYPMIFSAALYIPPCKRTRQWKIIIFNRGYIIKWLFFHCHVSFRGVYIPSSAEIQVEYQYSTQGACLQLFTQKFCEEPAWRKKLQYHDPNTETKTNMKRRSISDATWAGSFKM